VAEKLRIKSSHHVGRSTGAGGFLLQAVDDGVHKIGDIMI